MGQFRFEGVGKSRLVERTAALADEAEAVGRPLAGRGRWPSLPPTGPDWVATGHWGMLRLLMCKLASTGQIAAMKVEVFALHRIAHLVRTLRLPIANFWLSRQCPLGHAALCCMSILLHLAILALASPAGLFLVATDGVALLGQLLQRIVHCLLC